ncbi:Cytochrome P450 [Dillenia turbinata]|uniref:Cytochrome P450 n=1 Tax=Dillenia turbinata TaxID=194707 RepID=A0AAN8UQ53_9MAGN
MLVGFGSFLVGVVLIWLSHWLYVWRNPKSNGKLPPGSMGFPIIGETIQYFAPYRFDDLPLFFRKRVARYGAVFRTNILGKQVVISTDSELNHYIFQQEGKLFEIWYPESFSKIIGQESFLKYHGILHKYLKNLVRNLVSPEKLKENMLREMNATTHKFLNQWTGQDSFDVKEGSADMIFEYFSLQLFGYDENKLKKNLRDNYKAFDAGLISFPLNIPGTAYHACLQGRKNVMKVIKERFEERKKTPRTSNHDFLDFMLEEIEREDTILNEAIAMEIVFILLFATYETTSTTITQATKFLTSHPSVLFELMREHEAILQNRGKEESELTWKEYKSMTFTHMFINETLRLANIVPSIFRRTVTDVELKGYTIPAGWLVAVSPPALHLDPSKYENPLEFNPWRWQGQELHSGSKNFMAFGGGVRLCVGADFAKLQVAVFLHHLVTKYSWRLVKGGGNSSETPFDVPQGVAHQNLRETTLVHLAHHSRSQLLEH